MEPISILIESQNQAIESIRATRRELSAFRQDLAPISGAASQVEQSLEGVSRGFLDVARAAQGRAEFDRLFEDIAAGGEKGEAALLDFARVAQQVAPEAAQALAGELQQATTAVLDLASASGRSGLSQEDLARALDESGQAGRVAAQATAEVAAASREEAQATRQAAEQTARKGAAEEQAARQTRRHAEAARDAGGALRGARAAVDLATNSLDRMLPGLSGILQPLRQIEGALGGIGPLAGTLGLLGLAAGAVAGGLTLLGKSAADEAEELRNLHNATGAEAEGLQVLRQILRDSGVDVNALNLPLTELNKAIATGDPLLKALGVTAKEPVAAFLQLSRALSLASDENLKAEITTRILGGRSRELLKVIDEIGPAFGRTRRQMQEAGAILDPFGEGVTQLDEDLDALGITWRGLWNDMRAEAVPAALEIVKGLRNILAGVRELRSEVVEIPLFKFLIEQSREAKDAVANDMKEVEEALNRSLRAQLDQRRGSPSQQRERDFAGPLVDLKPKVTQEVGFVGPPVPREVEEANERLRRILEATGETARKRAKDIAELASIMHISRREAEQLAGALEQIDRSSKADSIRATFAAVRKGIQEGFDALRAIRGVPSIAGAEEQIEDARKATTEFRKEVERLARLTGRPEIEVEGALKAKKDLEDILAAFEAIGAIPPKEIRVRVKREEEERQRREAADFTFDEMLESVRKELKGTATLSQLAAEGLKNLGGTVQSEFRDIFAGILDETQTFGAVLEKLWSAILRSVLSTVGDAVGKAVGGAVVGFVGNVLKAVLPFLNATPAPGGRNGAGVNRAQETPAQTIRATRQAVQENTTAPRGEGFAPIVAAVRQIARDFTRTAFATPTPAFALAGLPRQAPSSAFLATAQAPLRAPSSGGVPTDMNITRAIERGIEKALLSLVPEMRRPLDTSRMERELQRVAASIDRQGNRTGRTDRRVVEETVRSVINENERRRTQSQGF